MKFRNLFKKKKSIYCVTLPARYTLYFNGTKWEVDEHGYTLRDIASMIFHHEPKLPCVAFAEQLGILMIITFGNELKIMTRLSLEEMRPCGVIYKYEMN